MTSKSSILAILRSADPKFYKEIALQPFSRSIKYLLLLVFIASLIISLKSVWELKKGIARFSYGAALDLAEMMPAISEVKIDKGTASSPVKQPFIFQKEDFVFILDTTGAVTSLDNYKEGVLLEKNKLKVKTAQKKGLSSRTEEYDLSGIKSQPLIFKSGDKQKGEILSITVGNKVLNVSRDNIDKLGRRLSLLVSPVLLLVTFVFSLLAKLFQVVLFSAASLLFNSVLKAKLGYKSLLNIGVYAITPPTILSIIVLFLPWGAGKNTFFLIWPLFYIFFYVVFLSLAIGNCRQEPEIKPL